MTPSGSGGAPALGFDLANSKTGQTETAHLEPATG